MYCSCSPRAVDGMPDTVMTPVVKARGSRLVYLPQEAASSFASEADLSFSPEATLHDSMLQGTGVKALQERLRRLEAGMASSDGAFLDVSLLPVPCAR